METLNHSCMEKLYTFNAEFADQWPLVPNTLTVNEEDIQLFVVSYKTFDDRIRHMNENVLSRIPMQPVWINWIGDEENEKKDLALSNACWPGQTRLGYRHSNTLSHWSIFLAMDELNISHALVTEDDSVLEMKVSELFLDRLSQTMQNLPDDYEIAWFGTGDGGHYTGPDFSNDTDVYQVHNFKFQCTNAQNRCACRRGMHAYMISLAGARKYLLAQTAPPIWENYMGNELDEILQDHCFWIEPPYFSEGSKTMNAAGERLITYKHTKGL